MSDTMTKDDILDILGVPNWDDLEHWLDGYSYDEIVKEVSTIIPPQEVAGLAERVADFLGAKKPMTLLERFNWHNQQALMWSDTAPERGGEAYLQRGQLHATLALAVAQRMTAKALEDEAQARRTGG